ncbi:MULTISPECIES: DUF1376 domain-containing protein [unclassified Bartonella]|uniref:DUF1376 domain-containing protein n=1 Tax=unclassified Bartonella TaxID=2645622 RepID=UPI0035CF68A7
MANKLPWVRNFYQEWIMDFAGTDAAEKATYSTLTAFMYRTCEPLYDDASVLARAVGCSVQTFKKSLEKLIRKKLIIRLENGNLWSAQVEEELLNCNENLEKSSEKASKAAKARWDKNKDKSNDDACAMHEQCLEMHNNININNNKKK